MKPLRYIAAILVLAAAGCEKVQVGAIKDSDVCIDNLGQIEAAKHKWYSEQHKTTNDVPTMADLAKYMNGVPKCPSGGTYTIGPVGKNPTCSIKGHELPASNEH